MKAPRGPSEAEIAATSKIRLAMKALKVRLEHGDNSELLHWVIPSQLACAQRPLRHHPIWGASGFILGPEATSLIVEWVGQIRNEGIRSIISLMHDRDIACYQSLTIPAGHLLTFYKEQGFQVCSIPYEDPHHKQSSFEEKREKLLQVRNLALAAYNVLPKPILVQCSAAIDRSAPVAAFILMKTELPNVP